MPTRVPFALDFSLVTGVFVLCACSAPGPDLRSVLQDGAATAPAQEWHVGPEVHVDESGPARFVKLLFDGFREKRAMDMVGFIDRFYRAPGNRGYDQVVDRLEAELREAGFGGDDPRFELEIIENEASSFAWTPMSASLVLRVGGEPDHTLHAFASPEGRDRVMLPVNSPSCDVEGEVVFHLDEIKRGNILVTDVSASQVMRRAQSRGAIAIISASLATFNEDPSGAERHLDAIQFRTLNAGSEMPVAQISPNTLIKIEAAVDRAAVRGAKVRARLQARVLLEERPVRTLVATIRGAERPTEAVAMVSHVQEPGASDNASGVAGLAESARVLAELLSEGKLSWPSRSLVFIWGDEFDQSEVWLENTEMTAVAGISSDMTGQSKDTGAIALLERMPDPGAIFTLPPDAHTPWGAGEVDAEELVPNGFAIMARCAMIDVGLVSGGGWRSADHPWEGGSDHDVFIGRGLPAILFWHFTDFTYHTSLDRMEFVDGAEIRRTGVAILATALAMADPQPGDLDRYLKSLEKERVLRLDAAEEFQDEDLAILWDDWCEGAREWLRNECLGIDEKLPAGDR